MTGRVSPAEAEVVVEPRKQRAAASRLALAQLGKPWAVASRHRTSLASLMTVPEGYFTVEDPRQQPDLQQYSGETLRKAIAGLKFFWSGNSVAAK